MNIERYGVNSTLSHGLDLLGGMPKTEACSHLVQLGVCLPSGHIYTHHDGMDEQSASVRLEQLCRAK